MWNRNDKYAGILIRSKRMEKHWSQEGTAEGICAVSYLSKIEQGKVQGSPEITRMLMERLGVKWQSDPAFVKKTEKQVMKWYEKVFAMEDLTLEEVREGREERLDSIFAPDQLLLEKWLETDINDPIPVELEVCLDTPQLAMQRILQERYEDAYLIYPCALTCLLAGEKLWWDGERYTKAMEYFTEAYQLACIQVDAKIMLEVKMMTGCLYSNIQDIPSMEENFRQAWKIADLLHDEKTKNMIAYNTGATYFEIGRYEEAYALLKQYPREDCMYWHKLALCCEKFGRKEEALQDLEKAETTPAGAMGDFIHDMCALPRYRIQHPAYLHDKVYGEMLMHVFVKCRKEFPAGYASFHLPWVIEWLTSNRMYKEAYELSVDFPLNHTK